MVSICTLDIVLAHFINVFWILVAVLYTFVSFSICSPVGWSLVLALSRWDSIFSVGICFHGPEMRTITCNMNIYFSISIKINVFLVFTLGDVLFFLCAFFYYSFIRCTSFDWLVTVLAIANTMLFIPQIYSIARVYCFECGAFFLASLRHAMPRHGRSPRLSFSLSLCLALNAWSLCDEQKQFINFSVHLFIFTLWMCVWSFFMIWSVIIMIFFSLCFGSFRFASISQEMPNIHASIVRRCHTHFFCFPWNFFFHYFYGHFRQTLRFHTYSTGMIKYNGKLSFQMNERRRMKKKQQQSKR